MSNGSDFIEAEVCHVKKLLLIDLALVSYLCYLYYLCCRHSK